MKKVIIFLMSVLTLRCSFESVSTIVIDDFNVNKYLGKWYEIARIDNKFQRGMINVTAEYSFDEKGTISVINRGYSTKKHKESMAKAKAYQTEVPNHLKVSFFPLVKGDYIVFYIDDDYTHALVSGGKPGYLWILSRTPKISQKNYEKLVEIAEDNGFDTSRLQLTIQKI